ncbi:metal ABC transporter permease [Clostridium cellulovorans]|uniref:ABC-3 protein n=1 Tax=Clostridium cellulovorans (strain ATCC 35296 / DSM 3052 / OCM 3 / 743B) TaxID=573061 RepID=D9SNN0_CLOC7|nr:metal ABC transporter permease [Clostridium cellulovorans]ADL49901.1 ABC-3 protein [Clostridium cellulovorans 743B]
MLQYEFMRNALLGALFISILCPTVGIFLVLKRYSMMGDTLAHNSFAGIALGLMIGANPLLSAFVVTSVAGLLIEFLRKYLNKYADLIMSIVLTLGIGIGITLISTGKASGNINSYLFGSMLTVTKGELKTMAILGIITAITLIFIFNDLVYITFDEEGAKIAGIKVKLINYIFILLVSATIAVSVKIVGILVISSMITLPVATALQFKKGFKATMIIGIFTGIIDIMLGLISSYYLDAAPGGLIALTSVIVLLSVIVLRRLLSNISALRN